MPFFLTVFKDVNTPSPFIEKFPVVEGEGAKAALPDHIYLDSMGFGMGMSCLQVTFINCAVCLMVSISQNGVHYRRKLIIPNHPVVLSHRRSTTVSLEAYIYL